MQKIDTVDHPLFKTLVPHKQKHPPMRIGDCIKPYSGKNYPYVAQIVEFDKYNVTCRYKNELVTKSNNAWRNWGKRHGQLL